MLFEHGLASSSLFTDEALTRLLDRHPREHVHALTMGSDPEHPEEAQPVAIDDVSGKDLLLAVRNGRLWLNVKRVDEFHQEIRDLVCELYACLASQASRMRVRGIMATLLISSPRALVYYHVDGAPSVLWHLRGRKRVWVYPAEVGRFISHRDLEAIYAGEVEEWVRYSKEFDAAAKIFDLEPGFAAAWEQNAPHRVTNHDDFNVSLSTEHFTDASRRRARRYRANHFLRRTLRVTTLGTAERGPLALAAIAAHRAAVAAGWKTQGYVKPGPKLRLHPERGLVPATP
jgi:hypothetical protein